MIDDPTNPETDDTGFKRCINDIYSGVLTDGQEETKAAKVAPSLSEPIQSKNLQEIAANKINELEKELSTGPTNT